MTFSVVVATLNAAGSVKACLESVLGQTWRDLELIVVDGGSSDGTLDVVAGLCDERCRVLRGPDSGIYDAWNKALSVVTGDWLLFLGADDVLEAPTVLEAVSERLTEAGPGRSLAYGLVRLVDASGSVLGMLGGSWEDVRPEVQRGMAIPNAGTFYGADLFDRYGSFDVSYRSSGDYEFQLRLLGSMEPLFLSGLVITRMGALGVSSEARSARLRHLEDLRAQRSHGLVRGAGDVLSRRAQVELREILTRLFGRRVVRSLANSVRRIRGRPILPRLPGSGR